MKTLKTRSKLESSTPWGWIGLSLAVLFTVGTFVAIPPYYQPESYHHFTDFRPWGPLPNALNVLSNLPFLIVGLWGWTKSRKGEVGNRLSWSVFYLGLVTVGLGSAWYHLAPNNATLLWDRLPMAWTFMALLTLAVRIHFKRLREAWVLGGLTAIGVLSVCTWYFVHAPGGGDLRFYGLVQFGGTGLAIFWFLTSKIPKRAKVWALLSVVFYTGAKLAEWGDWPVSILLYHVLSGHSVKHILAALSAACFLPLIPLMGLETNVRKGKSPVKASGLSKWMLRLMVGGLVGLVAIGGWLRMTDKVVSRGFFWPWPIYGDYQYPPNVERVSFESQDGVKLQAWWVKAEDKVRIKDAPVILFLHGNGGNLAAQFSQYEYLPKWGYDVLALDYRGFGLSEGYPSREGILRDVKAAMDYLKASFPNRKIAVIGHSMGTVFALQAAAHPWGATKVVVLAPFTTFNEIGETVMREWGTNPLVARWIAFLGIPKDLDPLVAAKADHLPPALFLHGTSDRVIPYEMGQRVYEAYRGPKQWLRMDGYGHENYHQGAMGEKYHHLLKRFLSVER